MTDRVRVAVADHVADVCLTRPEKLNALDGPMFAGIVAAAEQVGTDRAVRAVVLRGEGRAFCAGLDLALLQAGAEGGVAAADLAPVASHAQRAARVWAELPVPVVAAVHGVALGGGLQLALGADIRIVAPDARLGVLEITWGLVPDMSATQVLPRLVGPDRAKELVLTGRVVLGDEAVAIGLATRVADDPAAAAHELAREIAAKHPAAVRHAKQLVDLGGVVPIDEGLAAERAAMRAVMGSDDQLEAVRAALEGREPDFGG